MAKRPREGTEVREISKDQITHGFLDYGYEFAFYCRHHGKSLKGFKPDSDTHIQATPSGEAEGGEKEGKKQDVQRPLERWPPVWPGTERQAGWKEVRLEMQASARLPRLLCAAGGLPAGLTSSWTQEPQLTGFGTGQWRSSPAFPSPDSKDRDCGMNSVFKDPKCTLSFRVTQMHW